MAAPAKTYTFYGGDNADATQVMINFRDVIHGMTDGERDLTVSSMSVGTKITFLGGLKREKAVIYTGASSITANGGGIAQAINGLHDIRWAPSTATTSTLTVSFSDPTEGQVLHIFNDSGGAHNIQISAPASPADDVTIADTEALELRYVIGKWWRQNENSY